MRNKAFAGWLAAALILAVVGCSSSGSSRTTAMTATGKQGPTFSVQNNPTTTAGRGTPSLDDPERPAAWILIDGRLGKFQERDGHKQLQWVVEGPVSGSPRFRVEGYEPLLGRPRDFRFILKTVEADDGGEVAYAVSAAKGTFAVGNEYDLLTPGENFIIRNWTTGDVVREIAPLRPGKYLLAGDVRNEQTGKEAAAVTYFTVREGD